MMGASPKDSKTLIRGLKVLYILDVYNVFDFKCP